MRMKNVAILAVAACSLVACSGNNSISPAAPAASAASAPTNLTRPAWWREAPATIRAGVYVGQANGSTDGMVFGYKSPNKSDEAPLCSIGNQNFDQSQIAADTAGNVYSPNLATAAINEYSPNCGSLVRTIVDPYGAAVDVTVHGNGIYAAGSQTVAVCTNAGCGSSLTDRSIFQLETVAVDSHSNVWASYYRQNGGPTLIVWPGGSMPGHIVTGDVNQNTPGDLIFDKNDTLLSIQTRFTHAYVYHCSAVLASCTNVRTINLKSASLFGSLNARNTNIQLTDYTNQAVDVYTYPSFAYEYSYSRGLMPNSAIQGIVQTH